jgi:hypothetical protein
MLRLLSAPALLAAAALLGCSSPAQTFAPVDASTGDDVAPAADGGKGDGTVSDAAKDGAAQGDAPSDAAQADGPLPQGDGGGSSDAGDAGPAYAYAPTQAIGANLPFLFLGFLGTAPGGASAANVALDDAKAAGITHVRFIASGFYPTDMTQSPGWQADPNAYWAAFDAAVAAAGARGIRLVPSILWNPYLFPDINGEPTSKLFVKGSNTRTMAEKYVTELVTRYAGSDAILYWEIGNELNLSADIDVSNCSVCDGGANYCAGIDPPRGTPCQRTAADEFYSCNTCRGVSPPQEDLGQLMTEMASLIGGIDAKHPISSGNAYPRASAWHLAASPCPACDYTPDTPAQYQSALMGLHAGLNVVSVHHYPGPDLARFGSNDATGGALLALTAQAVAAAGKTLYVGEFGQTRSGTVSCNGTILCGGEATAAQTRWVLDDLVTSKVPAAAIWGFDFFQFCAAVPTCNSVIPSDPIVGAIAPHNAAMTACSGAGDAGAGDGGSGCPIGDCIGGVCMPAPKSTLGFDTAADVATFTVFTNCTACTPGTDSFSGFDGGTGGYVRVASNTLPCTGTCQFPGVYALSPKFLMPGPHALLRVDARSSAGGTVDVIPYDASGKELTHTTVAVPAGAGFASYALWFGVPAGTASASVRLELTAENATFDVDDVAIVSEP